MKQTKIPIFITFFLPIVSDNFPEKGLEIAAEIVKSVIIQPLYSFPPKSVMN